MPSAVFIWRHRNGMRGSAVMWRRLKPPLLISVLFYVLVMLWTSLAWATPSFHDHRGIAGNSNSCNINGSGSFAISSDALIAFISFIDLTTTVTGTPGGFTLLDTKQSAGTTTSLYVKVSNAETSNTFTFSATTEFVCEGSWYTGADTVSPVDVEAAAVIGSTPYTTGTIITNHDGELLLGYWIERSNLLFDGPSDMTGRWGNNGTIYSNRGATRTQTTAGSVSEAATSIAGTESDGSGWLVGLQDPQDTPTPNGSLTITPTQTETPTQTLTSTVTATSTETPTTTDTPTATPTATATVTPTATITPTFLPNDTCCQYDIPLCAPPSGVTGQCDGFPNGVAVLHASCINFIECMPFTPSPTVTRTPTTTPTPVVTPTAPTATFTGTPSETPTPSPTLAPGDCCSCTNFAFCSQGNCNVLCPDGTPPVPHESEICVADVGCSTPTAGASPTSTVTPTATIANTPIPNRCCIVPLFSGNACVADIWGDCGAAEGVFGSAIPTPIDGGSCAGTFPDAFCATVTPIQSTQTPTVTATGTVTQTGTVTPTGHMACFTPTPTPSPMHCKTFTPAPPTATPTGCPFTFSDNTGDLGRTCLFTGTYSPGCMGTFVPLDTYFGGDGDRVVITMSTQPAVVWYGRKTNSFTATLTSYRIGTQPSYPVVARASLSAMSLQIAPQAQAPFDLCAFPQGCEPSQACPMAFYDGPFVQVIHGLAPPPQNFLAPVAHQPYP